MIKVGLVSLGCPKNLVDSEIMLGFLSREPYRITSRLEQAQVVIVNTCAFLEEARRESQETLGRLAALKDRNCRLLIAAGCLVQYWGRSAPRRIPAADLLLGVGEYHTLPELVSRALAGSRSPRLFWQRRPEFKFDRPRPRLLSTPAHYAYVRIADGCDNRCRYCLIPRLRGPFQQRPVSEIVKEARELVARGTKELILVSQDTSRYGSSGPAAEGLSRLLEELAAIENLKWLRILYTHPAHLEKRVLQTMASSPTICPYLDIPLQHISDRVLKRMGRGVSRARIEALLDLARELVPGISLRTTLMVGFPGEGEAEFGELLEFVRWQRFDHLGVFVYSPEKGTPAARLASRIDRTTALLRRKKLMRTQKMIAAARLRKYRSATVPVLLDGPFPERSSRLMIGHTRFQAPEIDGLVVVEGEDLKIGDLIPVNVTSSSSYDLYGVADV